MRLIGINILVLLGMLLIVEIVLRIAGMGYSNSPTDADPVFNWVHPKNYLYKMYSPLREFGGYEVYFDSFGRRSQLPRIARQKPKSIATVAILGDSFVEALQVPYDSSTVGILSNRFPGTDVLNYGVTGYGPVYYYLKCKQMLTEHKVRPAAVFMVLYSNDVDDDSAALNRAVFDNVSQEIIAINGGKKNSLKALLRESHLIRLCRKAFITWKYLRKTKGRPSENRLVINRLVEESPSLDSTLSEQYILKTASLLKQHHIPFYLTAIPSRYVNFTRDTSASTFAPKAEYWAAKNQIPFINLRRSFDSVSTHTAQKLFYNTDVHCNASGYSLIADAMGKVMDTIPGIRK
jgi:lysophospholipase L1-like esterase